MLADVMPSSGSYGIIWETPRSAWMPKCGAAPEIDGRLDEACWRDAAVLTGFMAGANRVRSYANTVRLCYDDANFYIGCRYGEPNPGAIRAVVAEDGVESIWMDDCVELRVQVDSAKLFVPPYKGKPNWVQFITNTLGARFSQLVAERRPGSRRFCPTEWNDKWRAAASVEGDAWVSEIAIPWAELQITPTPGGFVKFNIGRNKPNKPESWNQGGYSDPRRFGTVHFGRDGAGGVEIRGSRVDCAGSEWAVAVAVVGAGPQPHTVRLKATATRDGATVAAGETPPVSVGAEPTTLRLPLRVEDAGKYDVAAQVVSGEGAVLCKGGVTVAKKPLLERFFLFRHKLFAGEEVVKGYFRLGALPAGKSLSARFELVTAEDGKVVADGATSVLTSVEGQFDMPVPPLPVGRYKLRMRVVDGRGVDIVAAAKPLQARAASPVRRERFTVHVDEPAGVARSLWPITFGVPFGEGMLAAADVEERTRVLDAAGAEIPCQSRLLATWTDARLYARWVLFDVQADLAPGKGADFTVEFGTEVARTPVADRPLAAVTPEGGVSVDTGPLQMLVSGKTPVFLNAIKVEGKPVTQGTPEGEQYLKLGDPAQRADMLPRQYGYDTDRSVKTFLAELCPQGCRVEIELNGPVRSVVKATGWYGAEGGERLFKYILRFYVHRGSTMIRGFHTFIATEPEQFVDSLGLRLRGASAPTRVRFGGDAGGAIAARIDLYSPKAALIQPSAEYYRVLQYLGTREMGRMPKDVSMAFGVQAAAGRRAPGWLDAVFGQSALLVAVRDFWQEHPKELSVDSRGVVDIGIVSAKSPAHLDLRSAPFTKIEQAGGDSEGVAKTTRFVLWFHKPDADDAVTVNRARSALSDPAAWVDPAWLQAADPFWQPVTRCTLDSADPRKRAYANMVEMDVFDQAARPDVVNGLHRYGILNYGDRMHDNVWRGWYNNEDYAMPFAEWVAYLATGSRPMLESVQRFSRHLMDVDTLNYTKRKHAGRLGLQSRHRRLHWGQPCIITHTYLDQSLLYYYLFGYERGADHAELIRAGQPLWDWWPGEGWWDRHKHPTGAVCRDYGVNLRICMNAYRHCWDPVLLVRAYELWERYKEGFLPTGDHLMGYFNVDRALQLFVRYTADPEAERIVLGSSILPILSAELGRPEKLQRALCDIDASWAHSSERIPTPSWALLHCPCGSIFPEVGVLAYAEKEARRGAALVPAPHPLRFNGDKDFLFLEEADREQRFRVRTQSGVEKPVPGSVTVLRPDGNEAEVKTSWVTSGRLQKLGEACIPKDGLTGVYEVRFREFGGGYLRMWLEGAPAKRVCRIDPKGFGLGYWHGQKFWFYVPKGCQAFSVGGRPVNRSGRFGFAVFNPENVPVASSCFYHNTHRDRAETRTVEVRADAAQQGKWWSIGYKTKKDLVFTFSEGLPPYVTDGPEHGFLPEGR